MIKKRNIMVSVIIMFTVFIIGSLIDFKFEPTVAKAITVPVEIWYNEEIQEEAPLSVDDAYFNYIRLNDPTFFEIDGVDFNVDKMSIPESDVTVSNIEEDVIPEPTVAPIEEPKEDRNNKIFKDEKLSAELQWYAKDLCDEYNVPLEIFIALMYHESKYDDNAIGGGHDYGMCQIRDVNHKRLRKAIGVSDFLNAKQNMKAGVYMLSEAMKNYPNDTIHLALMTYNGGAGYADKLVHRGIYSSRYSRAIVAHAIELGYVD